MAYTPYIPPTNRPNDLDVNGISNAGGGTVNQQVIGLFDLHTPPEETVLKRRHGVRPGFKQMLKLIGARKGKQNCTTGHYELSLIHI